MLAQAVRSENKSTLANIVVYKIAPSAGVIGMKEAISGAREVERAGKIVGLT